MTSLVAVLMFWWVPFVLERLALRQFHARMRSPRWWPATDRYRRPAKVSRRNRPQPKG